MSLLRLIPSNERAADCRGFGVVGESRTQGEAFDRRLRNSQLFGAIGMRLHGYGPNSVGRCVTWDLHPVSLPGALISEIASRAGGSPWVYW